MTKEKNFEKAFPSFIKQTVKHGVFSRPSHFFIEGEKWTGEAAGGYTSAQYYLAVLYYLGLNFNMALHFCRDAAKKHVSAQKMLAFWLGYEDAGGKNPLPWILEGAGLQGNEDAKKLLADYTKIIQKEKNWLQIDDLTLPKNWHEDAQAQLNYFIDCYIELAPEGKLKLFKKQAEEFKKENG